MPTDVVVRSLLGVRLEEPEEIPADPQTPNFEIAGFINREENRIVVAQKYKSEYRRFTMAHEIGHWVLHPGTVYHRDRPITGGERANSNRPIIEQEADLFAAELLMPTKVLSQNFENVFGGRIDGATPGNLARLAIGSGRSEVDLARDLRYRAMVVADLKSFRSVPIVPLSTRFGVSTPAMAIQLEDLRLVT